MHRVHPHPTLEPERIERCHHQARSPLAAYVRFPPSGFRMPPSSLHGLLETMHTAFGLSCLLGKMPHTLFAVVTKTLEKLPAFVPQSHVGRASEG